jgi:alcohol dehydrogenase, propanol-preferring
MAVQYAVAMGFHVIAVDVDSEKLWRGKDLGAEITLNAREQNVSEYVQSAVGGAHGVVVTAVSLTAFRDAIGMTRRKGTCVLVGLPPGDFPVPLYDVVLKGITIRGSLVGTRADLQEALSISADKDLYPRIQTLPLARANDAVAMLRAGKVEGRMVLTM